MLGRDSVGDAVNELKLKMEFRLSDEAEVLIRSADLNMLLKRSEEVKENIQEYIRVKKEMESINFPRERVANYHSEFKNLPWEKHGYQIPILE